MRASTLVLAFVLLSAPFIVAQNAAAVADTTATTTTNTANGVAGFIQNLIGGVGGSLSGLNYQDAIAALTAFATNSGLPIPTSVFSLPLGQLNLGSLNLNNLFTSALLVSDKYTPQCNAAIMQYNNITNTCTNIYTSALDYASLTAGSNVDDFLGKTTSGTSPILNVDGDQVTLSARQDWKDLCTNNLPICQKALESARETMASACDADVLTTQDTSIATTWLNTLCAQDVNGKLCYPAVRTAIDAVRGNATNLNAEGLLGLCNECTQIVIAQYGLIPQGSASLASLPLLCSTVGSQLCLPGLYNGGASTTTTSNSTIVVGDGPAPGQTDAQFCAAKYAGGIPGETPGGDFMSSPIVQRLIPCLSDFTSNTCSAACKASVAPLAEEAGCCFPTLLDIFLENVPAVYQSFVPNRARIVSFAQNTCGLPVGQACTKSSGGVVPVTQTSLTSQAEIPASSCDACTTKLIRTAALASSALNINLPFGLDFAKLEAAAGQCTVGLPPISTECASKYSALFPGSEVSLNSPLVMMLQPCLSDVTAGTCGMACKNALAPIVNNASCCMDQIIQQAAAKLPSAYAAIVPATLKPFIADTCGFALPTGCDVPATGGSTVNNPTNAVAIKYNLPNLNYDYYTANMAAVQNAIRSDLATALGLPDSAIAFGTATQVAGVDGAAASTSIMTYIRPTSTAQVAEWIAMLTGMYKAGTFNTPSLASLPLSSRVNAGLAQAIGSTTTVSSVPFPTDVLTGVTPITVSTGMTTMPRPSTGPMLGGSGSTGIVIITDESAAHGLQAQVAQMISVVAVLISIAAVFM